jgi:hypothetical protein
VMEGDFSSREPVCWWHMSAGPGPSCPPRHAPPCGPSCTALRTIRCRGIVLRYMPLGAVGSVDCARIIHLISPPRFSSHTASHDDARIIHMTDPPHHSPRQPTPHGPSYIEYDVAITVHMTLPRHRPRCSADTYLSGEVASYDAANVVHVALRVGRRGAGRTQRQGLTLVH